MQAQFQYPYVNVSPYTNNNGALLCLKNLFELIHSMQIFVTKINIIT